MSQPGKGKNKKCKRKWLENMRTCRWSFIAIFKPWGGGGEAFIWNREVKTELDD